MCKGVDLLVSPREVWIGWIEVRVEDMAGEGWVERRVVKRCVCARARAEERVEIRRVRWGEEGDVSGSGSG